MVSRLESAGLRALAAQEPDEASDGTPSRSAVWALALRALGSRDTAAGDRNPDWLAERLLGEDERRLIRHHPVMRAIDGDSRAVDRNDVRTAVWYACRRTWFLDVHLCAALAAGVRQVVVLGAGYDSRAWRFAIPLGARRVFEVDRAATQAWKRARVREVLGHSGTTVEFVPSDVCDQGITARLFGAGFQPRLPSFFILEGLLMYLTPVQTEATMRWIAGVVSPGSAVVFDYLTHAPIAPTVALNRDRLLASWGEPVRFRPPEGELPKQLESWGLECVVHESLDARPLPDRSWCVVAKT